MAMAMVASSTRRRLSEVNPDGANYFMEKIVFQIYEHFDEQYLIDVTFKLSNPTALVAAHRLILSAASPYFKEQFNSDNGINPLLEMPEIDSDTFERLITFCYTGKTLVTINNVDRMLKAALILQLDDAVTNCVDFLVEHITDYTLERAYDLEREVQCAMLSDKILKYEIRNFMSVVQSAVFVNVNANKLQVILESDKLNIPSEKDAFEAVKRWYEHDTSGRKEQLPDLVSRLRLTQFDTNFIITNIQSLPGCELLAFKTLSWLKIPSIRAAISLQSTNPRAVQTENSAYIHLLALNIWGDEPITLFQYDRTEDLWQKKFDIKTDVVNFRVIVVDHNLIFTGGCRNSDVINEVSSWNFKTQTFKQLPAMNEPRFHHCLAMLKGKMYVFGGFGVDRNFSETVEMCSASNEWQLMNNMITPRAYGCAIVFNEKIYIMGGYHEGLKSVECYDPSTNSWTQCADTNEAHNRPGATLHKGKIYLVGGRGFKCSPIVERYDPLRNEWTKICSLEIARYGAGCISFDNQLWVVGGLNENFSRGSVSVYDEQNEKWILKKSIAMAGEYFCFTVWKGLLESE